MKIHHLSSPLLLLLLPALSTALADPSSANNSVKDTPLAEREALAPGAVELDAVTAPKSAKGTLDAPIDGKDGRPHAGPWVETSAERDRKKTGSSTWSEEKSKSDPKAAEQLGPDGSPIPYSNDGVMDDPHRTGPKEGTRGTEGGVSEKLREPYSNEKTPGSPKEAPPLPHSESQKLPVSDEDSEVKDTKSPSADSNLGKLEKPADLPDKPHDIPPPKSPSTVKDSPLGLDKHGSTQPGESLAEGTAFHSLLFSFTMIIVSEIGDKTFLVAALMAMRHPRLLVFSAAFSALIFMTVLSAVLGHAVPTLIPKSVTKLLAAVLFLVFGLKMLKEGREMSPDEGVGEEMKEVEMELEEKEQEQRRMSRRSSVTPHSLEAGRVGRRKSRSSGNRLPSPPESVSSSSSRGSSPSRNRWGDLLVGMNNLFSLLLSPAWVQTFVMTFLGEWGDRSQIATIAMAAGQDYWWVTIGAITGHGLCTAAAVIGGSAIAGKVSMRVVTLGGATAFLVFGVIYMFEAIY
ncbi:UPF0016-domain-containing protein [Aspergillus sclerotioniger CBS 115572]|uniref:UPF0016-domain-containing protein n=1 Tax=Aspergillus sclerotioniger CBS 115572 TaxID=1450535 RepID=A0A317UYU7_9EURO|nr:UPF0016-domain-containing protein [Aspergillus sclerotioniger CBS 115572]PWY67244.1 UPF0016-domain-containing protein [Aspergillus sclerotioniger CBS 115572]